MPPSAGAKATYSGTPGRPIGAKPQAAKLSASSGAYPAKAGKAKTGDIKTGSVQADAARKPLSLQDFFGARRARATSGGSQAPEPPASAASDSPAPAARRDQQVAAGGERATTEIGERAQQAMASADGRTTLYATVASALAHSAVVRGSQADLDRARVDVRIAYSGYHPEVTSEAGVGTEDDYDYILRVSQPLFDWGRTGKDVERAKSELAAADAALANAAENATLEAAQAHIEVLRNQELLKAAQENLDVHKRFTQLAVDRTSGGVGDATEIELAGVHQGEAESTLVKVEGDLRDARSIYQSRVGTPPGNMAAVPELSLEIRADSLEEATRNAPAVLAAHARSEAARSEAAVQRAELLPRLLAQASVGGNENSDDLNTSLGLRLKGPTFNGLSNFRRVEAANLDAESARWSAEAARRDATLQVQALFNSEPILRRRIGILNEQLKKAGALRKLYEDQFTIGERSIADLANVQRDIFRIEQDRIAARHDILDLQYSAAAALGYLMDTLQVNLKGP